MAEIERTEHGDSGRARAWTLRAVRALHDPAWTADGYVSDRWRPVSPVTGRLDAFQWQTPVAALPSDKPGPVDTSAFEEAMLAPRRVEPPAEAGNEPPAPRPVEPIEMKPAAPAAPAAQDNAPPMPETIEADPAPAEPAPPESAPSAPAPCSGPVPTCPRRRQRQFRP